jgi:deoxyribodipyrimidine photo-lyase
MSGLLMSPPRPVILWFRRDLRLGDNPALEAAARSGSAVLPLFVLDETPSLRAPGAASNWWLERSLTALADDLAARGSRLILRRGAADLVVEGLARETGAQAVFWNALYDPGLAERDVELARALQAAGATPRRFNGAYLLRPETVRTKTGGAYGVFTPFWRAAREQVAAGEPLTDPKHLIAPEAWPTSERLADWRLYAARPDWARGFSDWAPGEGWAKARLEAFLAGPARDYAEGRDLPATEGTSRLSPHLHFGEIGPKTCWRAAMAAAKAKAVPSDQIDKFLAELGWREFNLAVAARTPDLARDNVDGRFDRMPWGDDAAGLEAWKRGRTGYPIVDAGMRQLWATGWMHNRVRMIVASFLTKHLLIDWRAGESWFWDTLVDADLPSNAGNWQWVAGSGADAQPFFRIFNPMLQGERFDPDGAYVKRWVPELGRLPAKAIHAPWTASSTILADAGVRLGATYPKPVVDHAEARKRALDAYAEMRAGSD